MANLIVTQVEQTIPEMLPQNLNTSYIFYKTITMKTPTGDDVSVLQEESRSTLGDLQMQKTMMEAQLLNIETRIGELDEKIALIASLTA